MLPHRLLLYLSLFGFTLEPRPNRVRYQPPKSFLHHVEFEKIQEHLEIHPAGNEHCKLRIVDDKSLNAKKAVKQSTKKGNHSLSNNNHPSGHNCGASSSGKHRSYLTDNSDSRGNNGDFSSSPLNSPGLYASIDDTNIFWESSLLLPAMPDEVRKEVGLLLADLIVRLKQLLFNSILCAYYVGFIPVQFADVSTCNRRHMWGGWWKSLV